MKHIGLILAIMTLCSIALAQKATVSSSSTSKQFDHVKNWYVGLGPVISTTGGALGGSGGTKFQLTGGWNTGLSEKWNFRVGYEMNMNTQSAGNAINYVLAGFDGFTKDRGADASPVFKFDLGYGGINRQSDGGVVVSFGFGFQFFRTKEFTLEAALSRSVLATSNVTGLSGYPAVDSLVFASYF